MELALLAFGGAALASAGLAAIELRERQRHGGWQRVELRFPRDVSPAAVRAVLDHLGGLPAVAAVALEVRADHDGIRHYLCANQATLASLRATLGALLPRVRLEPVKDEPAQDLAFGRSVRLRGRLGVLRTDGLVETSQGLLAALQPLGARERIVIRWLIRPGRPQPVPTAQQGQLIEPEDRRRVRSKNEGSVLLARCLVAAQAGHPARAAHLLSRVSTVLRSRGTAYGWLRSAPRAAGQVRRELGRHSFIFGDRYAAAELVGLLAWPLEAPALPGLRLGTSPLLMPSPRLPRQGRVLGTATWPGSERTVAQPVTGALSHSLITGPTGTGKSTLLVRLVEQDMLQGRGVVVIDGSKGDTAAAVLARVPAARRAEVIVLDCAAGGPQPGLKLFRGPHPELAADVVLGVLSDLFRDSWGPLSERYLRAGVLAVAHDPHGTLADVPYVFSDPAYRRSLVGKLHDPLTRATFAAFDAMSAGERQQQLAAPLNKLSQLLSRPIVRTVLGQADAKLDFREVLAQRRIVVISLAPALVGAPAARLIGALSVFALFQAVQGRAGLSERARVPFLVYIDEPKALGDLPMPLDALLEQARGLGVGLTLAPQSLSQLPKPVRESALTNAATRVAFRQDADDARLLARDLGGVTPEDLQDLAAFEAVARIGLGPGDLAPSVTLKTAPLGRATANPAELARASTARYGRELAAVDAALTARHHAAATEAPVGRRRRSA